MSLDLYGIRNCDTMKKARSWLDANAVAYSFHDYKVEGADAALLAAWCNGLGWEVVLNRAGTTFRALSEADRTSLDAARAITLMLAQPSMIKRPILSGANPAGAPILLAGFKPDNYAAALLHS
jgi:arsenate reductase